MQIHEYLFKEVSSVRYVAVRDGDDLQLNERGGLVGPSSSETDRYEELFVNPAIIQLTSSRGRIDCGGLHFIVVRYGKFFQYIQPTKSGHISIAIEPEADLDKTIQQIQLAIREHT